MKKYRIILMALIAVLSTSNVSAQSWLKKAFEKVDKVIETVDNTLGASTNGTEEKIDAVQEPEIIELGKYHYVPAFQNIKATTTSREMYVRFISCIRYNNDIMIEFEMYNKSDDDIKLDRFGSEHSSAIADNTGVNHIMHSATIAGKTNVYQPIGGCRDFVVFGGTKATGNIIVKNISKSATSFPLFRVSYQDNTGTLNFQFRKVPIVDILQINDMEEKYKLSLSAKENKE